MFIEFEKKMTLYIYECTPNASFVRRNVKNFRREFVNRLKRHQLPTDKMRQLFQTFVT